MNIYFIGIVLILMVIIYFIFKSVLKHLSSKECINCDQDGNIKE